MKIKYLLSQYKFITKEMKKEADVYSRLSSVVTSRCCSDELFAQYRASWLRLLELNEKAYNIMYEYRVLSSSVLYRVLFFFGVMPKQNGFRFANGCKSAFNYSQLINLVNLK